MKTSHASRLGLVLSVAALFIAALAGAPSRATAQLAALASVLLDQCDGTPDPCEAGDELGRALASGDFDGDGFADLAVGVPYEAVAGVASAGAVHISCGSLGGLRTTGDQFSSQSTRESPASSRRTTTGAGRPDGADLPRRLRVGK